MPKLKPLFTSLSEDECWKFMGRYIKKHPQSALIIERNIFNGKFEVVDYG